MKFSLTSILEKLEIIQQNKKNGRMVAVLIPPEKGELCLKAAEKIQDPTAEEDITSKSDLHITLALIDDNTSTEKIIQTIKDLHLNPFEVSVRGSDYFDPTPSSDGAFVLYAKVEPGKIVSCQKVILQQLQRAGIDAPNKWKQFGGYKPHITLKYIDKKIKNKDVGPYFNFVCDKIHLVDKEKKYIIRLKQ